MIIDKVSCQLAADWETGQPEKVCCLGLPLAFALDITITMNTDTYRYLLSALVQVFGALVAVDAVFVIFQQQNLSSLKAKVLFQVGRYVTAVLRYRRMYDLYHDRAHADDIDRDANAFQVLRPQEVEERIGQAVKWVANETVRLQQGIDGPRTEHWDLDAAKRNLTDLRQNSPLFHYFVDQYKGICRKEEQMPMLLVATMGVPACLVVAFSIALTFAGAIPDTANCVIGFSAIAASAIALLFLVTTAHRIMK